MGLFDFIFKLFSKKETQENNASDNSILTNEYYSSNNISSSKNRMVRSIKILKRRT